jgi:anti-anti-sigma factor
MGLVMTVALGGELDLANADDLARLLDGLGDEGDVHLDLREVEFLDCVALGVIISVAARVRAAGFAVTLHRPRPLVQRMIEISGLDRITSVVPA